MTSRWLQRIAVTTALGATLGTTSCGYFLHPERRGNTGGSVDGATLVMDLLWLLPGLVPGVVALIVDFSSGAIYTGGGARMAVTIPPDGHVALVLPESPRAATFELRLVTSANLIVARRTATVGPAMPAQTVELQLGAFARSNPHEKIYLEVVSANGASARLPQAMALRP